jgi:nucleoside-diphosphate-sugar epimerase
VYEEASTIKMADAAVKKLVVLGGTGFVGRRICARALQAGWRVTSLSYVKFVPKPFKVSNL